MAVLEIHDADLALEWLAQSACFSSVGPLSIARTKLSLSWFSQLAAADEPLLPIGIVGDIGHLVFPPDPSDPPVQPSVIGLPADLKRAYEDYFPGRLYADSAFERGSTALARYRDEDRIRGLAWTAATINSRLGAHGIRTLPSVTRKVCRLSPEELLKLGFESLEEHGLLPEVAATWRSITAAARQMGAALAQEDLFELESGTALVEFGQRIALRQVLREAVHLECALPDQAPRPSVRSQSVATNIAEEDTYPVGGFTSISTRGTIESLLHSQLAFMEKESDGPDLFDVKFLRSELLYYSRDENQFLRRRRAFVFVLHPELLKIRVKDPDAPAQRIILVLAIIVCLIRRIIEWLSEDSLHFELCFVTEAEERVLQEEYQLMELIFQEQIASELVTLTDRTLEEAIEAADTSTGRSLTHLVNCSVQAECIPKRALRTDLRPSNTPSLEFEGVPWAAPEECDLWAACLVKLAEELV